MFLAKDKKAITNFIEDEESLAMQHHRTTDELQFMDYASTLETQVLDYYSCSGDDMHHCFTKRYPNINRHRVLVFKPEKTCPRQPNEDYVAFQYGCIVSGYAIGVKNKCFKCGKEDTTKFMDNCGACRIATYCSRECQVSDYKRHKKMCKVVKSDIEKNSRGGVERDLIPFSLAQLLK
jgi:hypothetical protein